MKNISNNDSVMLLWIACVVFVLLIITMSIEATRTVLVNILGIRGIFTVGWFSGIPTFYLGLAAILRWLWPEKAAKVDAEIKSSRLRPLVDEIIHPRKPLLEPRSTECQKESNPDLARHYCVRCDCQKCRVEDRRFM